MTWKLELIGNKAKPEHYEEFRDLWKNADHGIAEVEDKKRMLVGQKKH